jgi:DNA-binding CsgD family transcriptional regulator
MSRSSALRAADVRAVFQLVGECRELGDDPILWRLHFGAGLGRLTGVGFAICAEMSGCDRGLRRDLGTAVWGWENGYDRAAWLKMLATFQKNPLYNPLINAYLARSAHTAGTCLARADLLTEAEWHRHEEYLALHRSVGADETLVCFRPIPGPDDEVSEVFLCRDIGDRGFSLRDRAVVQEAMAAVGPLVGWPLGRFGDPSPSDLPRRVRQVLRCLLEGDSDKQVATRMGLTRHTVNQYVKAIYRHFGVGSRPELLARWIRRGWGARFAWAD